MYKIPDFSTGGPSSSYEMIILRTNSHGGIIRVCIIIFTTALRKKKRHILKKKTPPYFHNVLLVIWPLTLMKRAHFSELCISRFSTYIRKAQGWKTPFPNARSEKRKIPAQNDRAATNPTKNPSTYSVVSFQFTTNLPGFRVSVMLSCSAVFFLFEIWKKPAKNWPIFLLALTF